MCEWAGHVHHNVHHSEGQRTTLWNWFSPFTFWWAPGIELTLFLLSHLVDPVLGIFFFFFVYDSYAHLNSIRLSMFKFFVSSLKKK